MSIDHPASPAVRRSPSLAMVDAVSRRLSRREGHTVEDRFGGACAILARRLDAPMVAVLHFDDLGLVIDGVWTPERYEAQPGMVLDHDQLPAGSPLRSLQQPIVLSLDQFGPDYAGVMRAAGYDLPVLVTPIIDDDRVRGVLAVLTAAAPDIGPDEAMAVQVCGELIWRQRELDIADRELRDRVEVAELLAHVGGLLQEGGIGEAREVVAETCRLVARYVEASEVVMYERSGSSAVPLTAWAIGGQVPDRGPAELDDTDWAAFETGEVMRFDADAPPFARPLLEGCASGLVVPGRSGGRLDGLVVVGRATPRPVRTVEEGLVVGAVELLSQFRLRMGVELQLVRRGVVEQARSEIAESFVKASTDEIDDAICGALERIGNVFGAHRVRWATIDERTRTGVSVVDWQVDAVGTGTSTWQVTADALAELGANREPFLLDAGAIRAATGIETASATLVVPASSEDHFAALVLSGDRVEAELPDDELRALTDLARLIQQARRRAAAAREAAARRRIDELQLRIARRFLDREVADHRPVVRWALAEIGQALELEVLAFAEYLGSTEGEVHWWTATPAAEQVRSMMSTSGDDVGGEFLTILDRGEPTAVRSRFLPAAAREAMEAFAGSEFSMLVVPLRAPGIALILGAAVLRDRDWTAAEEALLLQFVGQIRQFIDVVDSRARLEHDATHDALTGLANRRMISDALAGALADGADGAMLMIDVDRFKVVNDSLGHSAGDMVLVEIARRLVRSVRDVDLVARLGGDEFAVLVGGEAGHLELAATADRVISVIREPLTVRGSTVIPTCSVGIATAGPDDDVEAVFRHADAALYVAKSMGRDRYEFFDDDRRHELTERLHLETSLRWSVSQGRIVPWFQPEYDLTTGQVVGVEALARWDHPELGILDAADFIDTAEEIGLAPELSRQVLDASLDVLQQWQDLGIETRLRVNIAAAQLQTDELAGRIAETLDRHALPADRLCVELTERSLMLDLDSALGVLEQVRALGVEVAIDDFGTGFSSLARLKQLPIDTLKIDRSFIRGIVDHPTDREIVRTVIWLSRGLGLDVVAEGVEHREQAERLRELGCRRAQGWFWSRAVPAGDIPALIREGAGDRTA